jgi:hypothetical protein
MMSQEDLFAKVDKTFTLPSRGQSNLILSSC